jgi:hypothetical protein
MQLPLSFAKEPETETREVEPSVDVWPTLDAKRQGETRALLARLLVKAAASESTDPPKGQGNE